jgi:hypothetical protein
MQPAVAGLHSAPTYVTSSLLALSCDDRVDNIRSIDQTNHRHIVGGKHGDIQGLGFWKCHQTLPGI